MLDDSILLHTILPHKIGSFDPLSLLLLLFFPPLSLSLSPYYSGSAPADHVHSRIFSRQRPRDARAGLRKRERVKRAQRERKREDVIVLLFFSREDDSHTDAHTPNDIIPSSLFLSPSPSCFFRRSTPVRSGRGPLSQGGGAVEASGTKPGGQRGRGRGVATFGEGTNRRRLRHL